MIRVSNLKLSIDHSESELSMELRKMLGIKEEKQILEYHIFKQSIDARKKGKIYFVYTVDAQVVDENRVLKRANTKNITITPKMDYEYVTTGELALNNPPVIIGTGPAGLFAGLILAEMGYKPILLERGSDVDTRTQVVKKFWQTGNLDTQCNVQFGEGGAGTFSDGKLTTLIKNKRCRKVLEELVKSGAPREIIYSYKPHVGTDILRNVVKNIRRAIINLGGEFKFNSTVTEILISDDKVTGLVVNDSEKIKADVVVLAIGHSARDTFQMLYQKGVEISQKPFAIGLRIEHPQELINTAQYKEFSNHPKLGAADYKLSYHSPSGRSAYTFCMCPGGVVVGAASEEGGVVTNGMSEYARNTDNANSALLVGVKPGDFQGGHPLAGMEFQRTWERQAYELGGGKYGAPIQLVGDFLKGKKSNILGEVKPSYMPGVLLTKLENCLPPYVITTLKESINAFETKIKGFAKHDAVLTGVETRSSSPVKIMRDANMETNIRGLLPAGEGPGYAGGIISAAVDGIQAAETIAKKYRPL